MREKRRKEVSVLAMHTEGGKIQTSYNQEKTKNKCSNKLQIRSRVD